MNFVIAISVQDRPTKAVSVIENYYNLNHCIFHLNLGRAHVSLSNLQQSQSWGLDRLDKRSLS